jgi:predicted lipoprotein with Yx(FWY)xxD motif
MLPSTKRLLIGTAFLQAVIFSGYAFAAAPVKTADGALANSAGMTLYTFDKDVAGSGKSVCNDQCAALWPPLMAEAGAQPEGGYSLVTRDDGSKQWAYKGQPL